LPNVQTGLPNCYELPRNAGLCPEGRSQTSAESFHRAAAIELRHLRYFLAVSEELHFGRAAARLHIAQPPLSQAIRKLENELGVRLLNRTSRVVTPTAAGIVFAEAAREVLSNFDRAVTEARRAGGAGRALRIGAVPFVPIARLLQLVEAFRRRFPGWHTEVTHLSSLEQLRAIKAGELDVGIVPHLDEHDGIDLVPLLPEEPLVAYLSPDDPLATKDVIRPGDVGGSTLVTFARELNPGAYDWFRRALQESGFHFAEVHEVPGRDSLLDQLVTVAAGGGVTIAPFSIKDVNQAGGVVVRRSLEPELTAPGTSLALPSQPSRQLEDAMNQLREIAAENFGGAP
jgi:DNA-binding transcriptional LysR family regulator